MKFITMFALILLLVVLVYNLPLYMFTKEYKSNPRLYLLRQDMKRILRDEYIKPEIYHDEELNEMYLQKFGHNHPYNNSEKQRLNNYSEGGEPFWECIKKGKETIIDTTNNTMIVYRHTNKIGTCELLIQRFKAGRDGIDWDSAAVYFDKRLNIKPGTLTNHYYYYGER